MDIITALHVNMSTYSSSLFRMGFPFRIGISFSLLKFIFLETNNQNELIQLISEYEKASISNNARLQWDIHRSIHGAVVKPLAL